MNSLETMIFSLIIFSSISGLAKMDASFKNVAAYTAGYGSKIEGDALNTSDEVAKVHVETVNRGNPIVETFIIPTTDDNLVVVEMIGHKKRLLS